MKIRVRIALDGKIIHRYLVNEVQLSFADGETLSVSDIAEAGEDINRMTLYYERSMSEVSLRGWKDTNEPKRELILLSYFKVIGISMTIKEEEQI